MTERVIDIASLKIDFSALDNVPEGLKGEKGDKGDKGDDGDVVSITGGQIMTDGHLVLTLDDGQTVDVGKAVPTVFGFTVDSDGNLIAYTSEEAMPYTFTIVDGELICTIEEGASINLGSVRGQDGATGPSGYSPVIKIEDEPATSTMPAGEKVSITSMKDGIEHTDAFIIRNGKDGTGVTIDDTAESMSSTWSSQKISSTIQGLIDVIEGQVDEVLGV